MMNFIGRYAYVGEEHHGFEAVAVTERDEPQAVIGSRLHELAYPVEFKAHAGGGSAPQGGLPPRRRRALAAAPRRVPLRRQGEDGLRIYDVAQVDQKGFSERIVSAPVSPLGQRLYVEDEGRDVGGPAHHDDGRRRSARSLPQNQEQKVHPLYDYAFVTDREEGLVVVGPLHTLLDGNPSDNFVEARRPPSTRTASSPAPPPPPSRAPTAS